MDGLVWKTEFKKEPVAFGIFKIVIGAAIEDAKVSTDDVAEEIEDMENVQSVDIVAFNKLWADEWLQVAIRISLLFKQLLTRQYTNLEK